MTAGGYPPVRFQIPYWTSYWKVVGRRNSPYMHILHRKIKADALRALSGNWGKAIASTLLFGSICAFFFLLGKFFAKLLDLSSTMDLLHITTELRSENFLSEFLAVFLVLFEIIAIFVIAVPIFMGILRWYSHTVLCGCEEITTIFYYFSKPKLFFKSLLLVLNIVCRKVFWGLICLTPGGLVGGISLYIISLNSDGQDLFFAKLCIFVGTVLFLAGLIVFWLIGLRYSLACYLIIKEETLSVTRCIRLSRQYTLKPRSDLFRFSLSFLPFFIVSCFLFPILFVLPYYLMSFSIYAQYLIEQNQRYPDSLMESTGTAKQEKREKPTDFSF